MGPIAGGTLLALLSAVLFGVATPAVQRLGRGLGPFTTAALLYAGAAAFAGALLAVRRPAAEAPIRRAHLPRLVAVAGAGAVLAPVALAWGLQRSSGVAASLLLNLEAVFTIVLGVLLHREHVGPRVAAAAAVMTAGGALLLLGRGGGGGAELAGLAAVGVATAGWALDNALGRPLADLDPGAVVAAKGALGAALSFGLCLASGEPRPSLEAAAGLSLCGAAGYGVSLRLYLLAQRRLGAGRTASVFALAPFVGAAVARLGGEPLGGASGVAGGALMALGVALHLTERHEHAHRHEALEHEHAHRHDDGHHGHGHEAMPEGEHSHVHRHEEVTHTHGHAPDVHHRHPHG
jgi:drug/metabolite transporter (DMT)-like permease